MGYSPGGRKELDTTLHLSTHTIHSLWQLFLNCCQYLSNGRHFGHNALNVNLVFGTTPSALYVFSVAHRRILYTGKNIIYDQFNCVQLFVTPWTAAHQPSPTLGACSNSCPLSWSCHPTISSSVVPFSSCPQSIPASGSFQMNQLFTSGDQSVQVSASTPVLPMNT